MPTSSTRQSLLADLEIALKLSAFSFLLDVDDEMFRDEEVESDDDVGTHGEDANSLQLLQMDTGLDLYHTVATAWQEVWSHRYLTDRECVVLAKDYISNFKTRNDHAFRSIARVTKDTFDFILSKIQHHAVFRNNSRNAQCPIEWQLYCALDRLGHDGQGTSLARSRQLWALGHGTVHLYTQRVITALLDLEGEFLCWHNPRQRQDMSSQMHDEHGFKGCVGFVDGTTFPLHRKPADHGNVYMNRKFVYSVNAQVVVDNLKRIRHFIMGDPGSVHDASAFADSPLVRMPNLCFSRHEYLISDSAYSATEHLLPAYKDRQRDDLNDPFEVDKIHRFNTYLAKARVCNEHAIGMLKCRWRCLAGLRIEINDQSHIQKVVRMSTACVILHNMCLAVADEWEEQLDEDRDDREYPQEVIVPSRRGQSVGQRKRQLVREAQERWVQERSGGFVA